MTTKHTPGPWQITQWIGGEGHRAGFYVARARPDWSLNATEWMKDSKRRIAYFAKRETAEAAIAKAEGHQ